MSELAVSDAIVGFCVPPELARRELLGTADAGRLARTFQVLANDSRLRLLHALAREELCVSDLADAIGMTPQATSNHLQRLVDLSIVAARRDGNRVFYRIDDPCIAQLLELALCHVETGR